MPEETYDLLMRAKELMSRGHNHQAAVILTRACEQEPDKASLRETLAQALYRSGQFRRAGEEFSKALELDPTDHYAHFGLALSKEKLGERPEALGHLKLAVAMCPTCEDYRAALERLSP